MKTLLSRVVMTLALAGIASVACADLITVELLPNAHTVVQGGDVSFLAKLTNTTLDSYDLNSIQISLDSPLTADPGPFFLNFPARMDPVVNNPTTGNLFTVHADATTPISNYFGTVQIFGSKSGSGEADSLLGSDQFTVSVQSAPPVPEPMSMLTLALGSGLVMARRHKKSA